MNRSELSVVILAAGKGTRLEPISLYHSKAMTPICGVPIIAHVIDGFRKIGLNDFVVVKAPDDLDLDTVCDDLRGKGVSVQTTIQEQRLGTAHALLQARDLIHGDFVLSSCDNIFSTEHLEKLVAEHITRRPPAVVTLEKFSADKLKRSAVVKLNENDILDIVEKPGYNSSGWDAMAKFLFSFQLRIFDYIDRIEPSVRGELEIQDALRMLMDESNNYPRGVFADNFFHLTTEKDLIDIHRHYLKNQGLGAHPSAKIHSTAVIFDPVMIEDGVEVCRSARVGPFVYIGKGALIGENAHVENAVIYPRSRVDAGEKISGRIKLPE